MMVALRQQVGRMKDDTLVSPSLPVRDWGIHHATLQIKPHWGVHGRRSINSHPQSQKRYRPDQDKLPPATPHFSGAKKEVEHFP